jgi:hypothetical protein
MFGDDKKADPITISAAEGIQVAGLSEDQRLHLQVVELWNCRNSFEFVCPRYFSELEPTDDPAVRFCNVCRERVYQSRTPLDFVSHGELGHCVAVPEGFSPMGAFCTEMLGRPTRADLEENERHVRAIRSWWNEVLMQQPRFAPEAIAEVARTFRH